MNIFKSIDDNLEYMKTRLSFPLSADVIIREFTVNAGLRGRIRAFIIYFEGTTSGASIDEFIIQAMHLVPRSPLTTDLAELIKNQLVSRNQFSRADNFDDVISEINYGGCGLFIDTIDTAFTADVKGWNARDVSGPSTEAVIKGPQQGFNEIIRTNTGLVRKIIRSEKLICEQYNVGNVSVTSCDLLYIKDVVSPGLLTEVRRRIKNIDVDFIMDSGELEQLLEDFTVLPTPQMISTERPDRVAAAVAAGKIAIIVDGSPFALILPINVFELMHSPEDNYLRYPYANLIRTMRLISMLVSLLLPGIFIAVTTFHQEILPAQLLFAIEATREKVPFNILIELIILEFAFEFIREASIRMPGTGGTAIGIIGGLIVGQAAVEANIASPIVIIIVALTGLGSFVVPSYSLGLSFRIVKYFYIILGAIGGLLGITLGIFLHLIWLTAAQSFGVPFLAPLSPVFSSDAVGAFFVKPIWKREKRQSFINPQNDSMQPHTSRKWARGKNSTVTDSDTTDID